MNLNFYLVFFKYGLNNLNKFEELVYHVIL